MIIVNDIMINSINYLKDDEVDKDNGFFFILRLILLLILPLLILFELKLIYACVDIKPASNNVNNTNILHAINNKTNQCLN